jgi:hypothetical protein
MEIPKGLSEDAAVGTVLQVEADIKVNTEERNEHLLTTLGLEQGDLTKQQFHDLNLCKMPMYLL